MIKYCEFGVLQDEPLMDRIVCGNVEQKVREKLLQSDDLTLAKAIKLCQVIEMSHQYLATMSGETDNALADVNTVHIDKDLGQRKPTQMQRGKTW